MLRAPTSLPLPSLSPPTADLLDALDVGVWDLDHTTRRITWSRALREALGYDIADLDGASFEALLGCLHPEDRGLAREAMARSVDTRELVDVELRFRTAQGRYLSAQMRGRVVSHDAAGNPLRTTGTWTDVSARKATERLRAVDATGRRRANLEDFFGAIDDFVFVLDGEGVIRHVNAAAARALAQGSGLTGRRFVDLYGAAARAEIERLLAGERPSCLVPLGATGGAALTVDVRRLPAEWDGEPAQLCVARDVTQEVEARLRAERGETLLRTTLEATADGILVVAEDGRVLAGSPRFRELWRIPEELFLSGDDARLLAHVSAQLVDPEGFISEVRRLYGSTRASHDTLRFLDGRVFERTSRATEIAGRPARVWSFRDVTERERAAQELEEERSFLRSLVRAIPDLVWLKDPQGVYLRCNQQFERLYGAKEAEIVGKTDHDFVPPALADFFREHDQRALALDQPTVNEEWLTFAEGGYRGFFETVKTPMRAADGRVVGVLGVARDITAQRNIREELRTREELYRTIVSQAADGIVLIDPRTLAFVEHNEAAAAELGYSREELASLRLSDVVVGIPEDVLRERMAEMLREGKGSFETRHVKKDGSVRDVWVSNRTVVLRGVTHITAIWRDTTERRRMDAQLRLSEERLSFALQGSNDGLWDWNLDTDDLYLSPRCLAMVGYTQGELPSTLEAWKRLVHPDDREPTLAAANAFVSGQLPKYEVEFRLQHKDGHWVDVLSRATLTRDAAGRLTSPRRLIGTHFDLTERKRFERQLADASERWHVLFEQSRDGIVLLDPSGAVAEHNGAFAAMLGHSRDELAKLHVWDWDPDVTRELMSAAMASGARDDLCFETLHRHKDGGAHPVEVRATRVPWAGTPHLFCVVRDIGPRKRAEEQLRESEFFLRESQVIARVGGWKVNLDTEAITWTEGIYRLVERPLDAPITLAECSAYYAPEELERVVETFRRAWAADEPFDIEARFVTQSGRELWGEVRCVGRIATAAGPFLAGTIQDVTQRKRTELELTRYRQLLEELVRSRTAQLELANRRLTESDLRLSAMFSLSQEASDLPVDVLLQKGLAEAVRLSGSAEGHLRLLEGALPDAPPLTLSAGAEVPVSSVDADLEALWAKAVRLGVPVARGAEEGAAVSAPTPRRAAVPVAEKGRLRLLLGVGGRPSDYLASDLHELELIGNDLWRIYTRRRAELQLADAKEVAETASRAKSSFLANMSHEIRTPLNAIIGLAHLSRRSTVEPAQAERLDKIREAAQHLLGIINDVLDLSKIEAGKVEPLLEDYEPVALVEEVADMLRPKALAKGLVLQTSLDPALPRRLRGDPLRIRQILLNFVGNAVKFTERGSVRLAARPTRGATGAPALALEVRDTGIGLTAEEVTRLFRPFEQGDASTTRAHGGTGLGLAISKRLVELLGGELGAEGAPGQGSLFWCRIPYAEPSTTSSVAQAPSEPAAALTPAVPPEVLLAPFRGARVLLAEDNPINQEVAGDLLRAVGLRIDVVDDGLAAVERARRIDYDAILMDVQMPRLDGLAASRLIRALPGRGRVPILAMTANAFDEDRRVCLEAGMDDHVPKPVDPDGLYSTLARWLATRRTTPVEPSGTPAEPSPPRDPNAGLQARLEAIRGLDVASGLGAVLGRMSSYGRLLAKYLEIHADDVARLRAHRAAGEAEEARRLAHTLKGVAATLGLSEVRELALRVEQALRGGDDATADELLDGLDMAQTRLCSELRAALAGR